MSFSFREDGFFNMTKAAQQFGKRLQNFLDNAETTQYIDELAKLTPFGVSLVEPKMGRNGGTFAHPKLAVFFARWLDVRFAVWCDAMIEDILTNKAVVTIEKPEQSTMVQTTKAIGMNNLGVIQGIAQFMDAVSKQLLEQATITQRNTEATARMAAQVAGVDNL